MALVVNLFDINIKAQIGYMVRIQNRIFLFSKYACL
jgi:hypothetical protein